MAEIPSWQRQSFAKSASTGPSKMHAKIAGNSHSFHSKIAKPTVQNYADGGMVQDDVTGVDEAIARNTDNGEWARGENYGDGTTGDERVAAARAPVDTTGVEDKIRAMAGGDTASEVKVEGGKKSFKDAFAENRKAGNSTFEWNGKKFSTDVATAKPAARKAPAPQVNTAPAGKTFAEDVAERKKNLSVEKSVERAMARDENYSNEGRRSVVARPSAGKGIIDTSNIDSKTLLPKR